jgi:hypothetical protein
MFLRLHLRNQNKHLTTNSRKPEDAKSTRALNPLGKIRQDPEGFKSPFSSDFLKPTVSDKQSQQLFSGDNVFLQCQEYCIGYSLK